MRIIYENDAEYAALDAKRRASVPVYGVRVIRSDDETVIYPGPGYTGRVANGKMTIGMLDRTVILEEGEYQIEGDEKCE